MVPRTSGLSSLRLLHRLFQEEYDGLAGLGGTKRSLDTILAFAHGHSCLSYGPNQKSRMLGMRRCLPNSLLTKPCSEIHWIAASFVSNW